MPEGRPPALRALIKDCLTVSPQQRPTMQQVVARLEALAPADMQQAPPSGTPVRPQSLAAAPAAGAAPSSERQPLHERAPSQGWADFSSDSPAGSLSPGGGPPSRRHSGSLASWATFSPKRAAEVVAGAAGAVAAGAGSFWSSFGEQVPSEPPEPLVAPAEQAEVHALSSEVEALSSRQAALPPAQRPAQQQAAGQAAAAQLAAPAPTPAAAGAAEVSPLSAGLARMTLGGSSATPAPPREWCGGALIPVAVAKEYGLRECRQISQPASAWPAKMHSVPLLPLQRLQLVRRRLHHSSQVLHRRQWLGQFAQAASEAPWAATRRC